MATGYLPSLNYPGSSGYGVNAAGQYGRYAAAPKPNDTVDYAVIDPATGKAVSLLTGKPWSGKEPRTGQVYANGVPTAPDSAAATVPGTNTQINPNDPNQRYSPVSIAKPEQAPVTSAADDMLKSFKDTSASALKDFSAYLSAAKDAAGGAQKASATATDIAPLTADLQARQRQYAAGLGQDVAQMTDTNAATTAAEQGIVKRAADLLPSYDAAATNTENLGQQAVINQLSRYGASRNAGAGMNLGAGTDLARVAASEAMRAAAPFEMAKVNQNYNLLENLNLPVAKDIGNRLTAQYSVLQPQIQAAQFQTAQGTAQAVQTLKQYVAQSDWQNVMQLLQIPQMANAVRQAIQSGDVSLLGALSQLEAQGHYTGLQDLLGVNLSQPVSYSNALPPLPNIQPRYPSQGPQAAPAAPTPAYNPNQYPGPIGPALNYGGPSPVYTGGPSMPGYGGVKMLDADGNPLIPNLGAGYGNYQGDVSVPLPTSPDYSMAA